MAALVMSYFAIEVEAMRQTPFKSKHVSCSHDPV